MWLEGNRLRSVEMDRHSNKLCRSDSKRSEPSRDGALRRTLGLMSSHARESELPLYLKVAHQIEGQIRKAQDQGDFEGVTTPNPHRLSPPPFVASAFFRTGLPDLVLTS